MAWRLVLLHRMKSVVHSIGTYLSGFRTDKTHILLLELCRRLV